MAVAALESGANVLFEKPAAIDHPSLMRLQRAQTESGKQLGICFQNRYNVGVLEALRLMREGKTGSLVSIRANVDWCRGADYYSDDWHGIKAREGGGVLVNQAVHTLDLLQMFAFSPAVSVLAHIANDHMQGVIDEEDTALLRAVFQNGVMGQLHATTAFQSNARVEIDLFFQHDTLRLSGPVLQRLEDDGTATTLSGTDTAVGSKAYWGTGHAALIADYYRCLRTHVPFPIDAFEGGKAVELFLAAYRSAERGGEKVDVE
jgi:predicted dehydrogenase